VRQDILDAIVRAVADDGRTVVFSSHLLEEVERMSDHVTMIHQGRIALDGSLEDVRGAHRVSQLRFATRIQRMPRLDGALSIAGGGRSFSVLHDCSIERLHESIAGLAGEISESRSATLEELFIARVGRSSYVETAA
jgi:ABC-2 type transport system ATP-binding protein